MFSRWGAFVYRHRRIVLVLAIVVGVIGASAAGRAASVLSAGGWLDPGSESAAVANRLADEFGAGRGALIAVYRGADGTDARSDAFQAAIAASLADLVKDPDVSGTIGYAETGDARFISNDGQSAYVVVDLNVTDEASVPLIDRFESEIHEPTDGTELLLGGYAALTRDSTDQSEQDLVRAETVSLPIAAFVLILVFTSLISAGIPLLVAGLAIPTTLALVYVVGQQVEMSVYVSNVVDDAGARARDRLLAVHGQPVPRGAEEGPRRRQRRRDRRRHVRQGRHVLGPRGRHRARRPARVQRPGAPLVRHRRDADRVRVPVLRHDLPAGAARHPRTEGQLAVGDRA